MLGGFLLFFFPPLLLSLLLLLFLYIFFPSPAHSLVEIRVRSLRNIVSKLQLSLVSPADLVQERQLFINLLHWFNFPEVPLQEEVLQLINALATVLSNTSSGKPHYNLDLKPATVYLVMQWGYWTVEHFNKTNNHHCSECTWTLWKWAELFSSALIFVLSWPVNMIQLSTFIFCKWSSLFPFLASLFYLLGGRKFALHSLPFQIKSPHYRFHHITDPYVHRAVTTQSCIHNRADAHSSLQYSHWCLFSRPLKHPTGAHMLRDVGGVDFLTQLSSNIDPQLRTLTETTLDQLFHLHVYPPSASSDQHLSPSFQPGKHPVLDTHTAHDITLICSTAQKNVLQEHHPNTEYQRHLSFTMRVLNWFMAPHWSCCLIFSAEEVSGRGYFLQNAPSGTDAAPPPGVSGTCPPNKNPSHPLVTLTPFD